MKTYLRLRSSLIELRGVSDHHFFLVGPKTGQPLQQGRCSRLASNFVNKFGYAIGIHTYHYVIPWLLFLRGGATDFRATQSTSIAAAAATSMISPEAHESFIRSQGHSATTDTRHYRHLLKEHSAGVTAEGKNFHLNEGTNSS